MRQIFVNKRSKNLLFIDVFRTSFILLTLTFGMLNSAFADQKKFYFESITNEKGLTHNTVFDICQDNHGFMWFATDGGLNRYDGQNLKNYLAADNNNSLPSNSVTNLIFTADSLLFAGTLNGLAVYKPETDEFIPVKSNNKSMGEIIDLQQGIGKELLISTNDNGTFIYNYQYNTVRKLSISRERVYGMTVDRNGFYWAYTRFALFRFDKTGKLNAQYNVSPELFNSAISLLKTDIRGVLWVGTFEKGLFTFNFSTHKFEPFATAGKDEMYYIRTLETGDNPDEYWVGTERGLYILNIGTGNLEHYTQSFDINRSSINDNAVYKIYRNKQNIFFIGTYFGGVNIARTRQNGFNSLYPDNRPGYLNGKALGAMTKAPDGKIWIATEDAGIAIFNPVNQLFEQIKSVEGNPNSISTNNVHALLMDKSVCWSGHFMGGLCRIDLKSHQAKRYLNQSNNPSSLNNNFIFALYPYSKDSLLIGTITGVDLFDKKTEKFSRFRPNELFDCSLYAIFGAPDGKIWFCTYNKGIFIYDKKNPGLMKHYSLGDNSGLPGNSVISYYIDSKHRIWIGTRGNGLCLYNDKTKKFKTFTKDKLLINNVVYGILEDSEGYIWVSSNQGISRINFTDSTSIHFNFRHGIAGNQFNYKSYFKDTDGTMYFGSVKGLTWFKPELIMSERVLPNVYFSNLRVFNEEILPGQSDILTQQIDFTDKFKLQYNQNSITIEFSSVNFYDGDITYEYYLEGLEDSWSPLSPKMQANYTNLSPGKYTFHIRANNKIGNVTGPERILHIRVMPPFWLSWFAYFIYFLLFLTVIWMLYRNYLNRQKEKVALAIEKIEKENLNVLHQHKMNFFTYISHEFKTPLSIIIASAEMLFQRNKNEADDVVEIQKSIKRSASRLLFLVNQLMEFRKIETDHETLNLSKGNLMEFINQILNVYRPLLSKKEIDLNVKMNFSQSDITFDFDKLEKIMTNLLTNAVKYTPQKGKIGFSFQSMSDQMEFSVSDSGPGMTDAQKDKIFEVFYSEHIPGEMVESSGIGLALTAGLVKFLKGEIQVESKLSKGSKFSVKLPFSQSALSSDENIQISKSLTDLIESEDLPEINESESLSGEFKSHKLVIVEDNKDLLMLLNKNFREKYQVKCFENGKDAWKYISEKIPDLVITDIMMPMMSGTELCDRIKADVRLSHIPVIMLSAKATAESRIEGLQTGADEYISKPFSMEELDLRVSNILQSRKSLVNKLNELAQIEKIKLPETNQEQQLIEKIYTLIRENITNNDLSVQYLADHLNISRTNLHNKIKALLNMNSTEFINTIRINLAKELIAEDKYSIAEITFMVGYKDSAYLNRIFKKLTGLTPGEFKKSIKR